MPPLREEGSVGSEMTSERANDGDFSQLYHIRLSGQSAADSLLPGLAGTFRRRGKIGRDRDLDASRWCTRSNSGSRSSGFPVYNPGDGGR